MWVWGLKGPTRTCHGKLPSTPFQDHTMQTRSKMSGAPYIIKAWAFPFVSRGGMAWQNSVAHVDVLITKIQRNVQPWESSTIRLKFEIHFGISLWISLIVLMAVILAKRPTHTASLSAALNPSAEKKPMINHHPRLFVSPCARTWYLKCCHTFTFSPTMMFCSSDSALHTETSTASEHQGLGADC